MNKRILLADDSLTIQKVVELTFMDESFDVVAVGSGDEAIASLQAEMPDILVADVHMPGPSGYEVCRRAKETSASLPVLLLVGTFETLDEAEMEACGADDHLKKPFDSQELLQIVRRMTSAVSAAASAGPPDAPAAGFDLGAAIGDLGDAAASGGAGPAVSDLASSDVAGPLELETPGAPDDDTELPGLGEGVSGGETLADEAEELSISLESSEGLELSDAIDLGDEPTTDWELASGVPPMPQSPAIEPSMPEPPMPEPPALESPEPPIAEPDLRDDSVTESTLYEPAVVEAGGEPGLAAAGAAGLGETTGEDRPEDGGLSDDDVERVARRVVEILADETIREVAWDVVPDMAEIVIKDRIRELEAEAEAE